MKLALLQGIPGTIRESLRAPVDPQTFGWFRRFFLGKFFFLDLLHIVASGAKPTLLALARLGLVGGCVVMSELRHQGAASLGVAGMFLMKLAALVASFPYTINHAFFDAALLLVLALDPLERTAHEAAGIHPLRVAQAGILTVFFYAGVQKLVHGYYLNGEMLSLRILYSDGDMGRRMRWGLSLLSAWFGLPPPPAAAMPRPNFMMEAEVPVPVWVRLVVYALSNGTWIAEIGLPLLAIGKARRGLCVLGLLGLEGVILILSGEISFGFTVVACLLSFFPRAARWVYVLGFVTLGAFAVATLNEQT